VRLYLDLKSAAVNERHEWNYELCGDGLGKYYSSAPWLLMAFHTDKFASNHTGFRAFYRFLDKRKHRRKLGVDSNVPTVLSSFIWIREITPCQNVSSTRKLDTCK